MPDGNTDATEMNWMTRRRLLGAGGAAAVGMLAGCGGGDTTTQADSNGTPTETDTGGGDTGEETETSEQGDPADPTLSFAQWPNPNSSNYNPYNTKNFPKPRRFMFDRFMYFNLASGEYEGYAVSDWEWDGNTISLTVRDGLTWQTGQSVTADDLLAQLELDMYTGGTLKNYLAEDIQESVQKIDDKTVELRLSDVNTSIAMGLLQPKHIYTPYTLDGASYDGFGRFVERYHDATTDDERSAVTNELTSKWTITPDDDPVGAGPFQFEDADSQRTLLTKYEDHPDADQFNYPELEYRYSPSNQKRWQMLQNGVTDGYDTLFMPENQLKKLPDNVVVGTIPRHYGMGLIPNWENKHLGKRKVRQAFAYAIRRQLVARNSGGGTGTKAGVNVPSGITSQLTGDVKEWLGDDYDKFEKYQYDTEKAATLMREAGYSKSGGMWRDSDGNKISMDLKVTSAFSDWVSADQTIVSLLQDFGIDANLITESSSTYWGKSYVNSDFDMATQSWTDYGRRYPFFHQSWMLNSNDATSYWNVPETVEVPPYGQPNAEPEEVNPLPKLQKLSSATGDQAAQLVKELAWIINQSLPAIPMMEKQAQTFMTTDDWNVPAKDSDKLQTYWPNEWLPRRGDWTAKLE
ncbi:ABC transporter substrate-binding protein [Halorhabdus sp. CBA1104]|uniref:ABC transporter substrate-binding protein n=1 Tax=Halorhabdus sp. CBA1104 TaxID=1380432 RepID=UPI0012B1BE97|nr:ABC transporter substrate-binding protein [Halorhabdus sp. CBA1104]QGN07630.1 ABC transporter substrate-binding protein [Halorhabdus sp. CBA1104]